MYTTAPSSSSSSSSSCKRRPVVEEASWVHGMHGQTPTRETGAAKETPVKPSTSKTVENRRRRHRFQWDGGKCFRQHLGPTGESDKVTESSGCETKAVWLFALGTTASKVTPSENKRARNREGRKRKTDKQEDDGKGANGPPVRGVESLRAAQPSK